MPRTEAAKLASRLISEAQKTVGGPTAWARLHLDAQIDAVRARAWLMVQSRVDVEDRVTVRDVFAAMEDVYSRETL